MKTSFEKLGFEISEGWHPLVKELMEELKKAGWNGEIRQVKEKFGGLRFYIGEGSEEIWAIIEKYERKSYTICEVCGEPGKPRKGGWIKTLCDTHDKRVA